MPYRSTVYAPALRILHLEYSDCLNDSALAEIVAICRGTLQIRDYYGDWVSPALLAKKWYYSRFVIKYYGNPRSVLFQRIFEIFRPKRMRYFSRMCFCRFSTFIFMFCAKHTIYALFHKINFLQTKELKMFLLSFTSRENVFWWRHYAKRSEYLSKAHFFAT